MPLTIDCPAVSAPEAGVIEEARTRQRRHRALAAATVAALVAVGLVALIGPSGAGPGARSVGVAPGSQTVHAGPLTVTLPANWQWRILHGFYVHRGCTAPVSDLALASYRRPALVVHQGGATVVVPPNQVELSIGIASIRTSATPWKHWRLSNQALRPYHPVIDPVTGLDPNRIRAEVVLTPSGVATAVALLGSMPMSNTALAAANSVLRSIRVGPNYACR